MKSLKVAFNWRRGWWYRSGWCCCWSGWWRQWRSHISVTLLTLRVIYIIHFLFIERLLYQFTYAHCSTVTSGVPLLWADRKVELRTPNSLLSRLLEQSIIVRFTFLFLSDEKECSTSSVPLHCTIFHLWLVYSKLYNTTPFSPYYTTNQHKSL